MRMHIPTRRPEVLMKRILASAVLLTLLGCATVETETEGTRLYRKQVEQIKPGITTEQAVRDLFGEPTEIRSMDGQKKYIYTFKKKSTPSYLGGVVEDQTRKQEATSTLEMVIKDGIVYSYNFTSVEN